jgi:tetratricopeptide (TPR) repeat protein
MKTNIQHWLNKILFVLLLLLTVAFSLKSLREPDLWWQICTGQWILEHKQVPVQDVFSYTYEGAKWVNIKWGFEVVAAIINNAAGPEYIYVLQALVSICILLLLLKYIQLINQRLFPKSYKITISYWVSMVVLLGVNYRMIGRPEMLSHLFSLLFIYLINKYRDSNSKALYLLVLLQLCWTNMHEAFGLGIIILLVNVGCAWVEYLRNKQTKPIQLSIVGLLCILSTIINPYGFEMMVKPFEIFSQLEVNKFTTELSDYTQYDFWQKEAYISFVFFILSIITIAFVWFQKTKVKKVDTMIHKVGLGNIVMLFAFAFLASTAYRNIVFFFLMSAPFVAAFLQYLINFIESKTKKSVMFTTSMSMLAVVFGIAIYVLVVNNTYYKLSKSNDRYGLGILENNNPEGAAKYLEQHQLTKGKVFTDYLSSSYLMYRLQPDFKTFFDLRDLDVFPSDFFQTNAMAYNNYDAFKALDSQYHFSVIVLLNRQFNGLQSALYNDSNYSLRFVDPLVSVFMKQIGTQSASIGFSALSSIEQSGFCQIINKVFNPFYKSDNGKDLDNNSAAASFYLSVRDVEKARAYALKSIQTATKKSPAYLVLAQYYNSKSVSDTSLQNVFMDSASFYFNAAIKEDEHLAEAYIGLGAIQFRQGSINAAIKLFEKCCDLEPSLLNGHLYAAEAYKSMVEKSSDKKYVNSLVDHLIIANSINPNNPDIEWNLGVAYYKQGNCSKATPLLQNVLGFSGLSAEDRTMAEFCISNCKGR